jgi:CBS domain containing-hemolysin-like protein
VATALPFYWTLRALFFLTAFFRWCNKIFGGKEIYLREDDVIATAMAATDQGALHPEEAELIKRVLVVGNQPVAVLMVPLANCLTVPERTTRRRLSEALGMHSNVIVHAEKDPQTIRGIVERNKAWELADRHSDEVVNLKELVKPLAVLTSDTLVEDALDSWKNNLGAIVTDGGKMVGIVMRHHVLDRMIGADSV